MTEKFTPGPWRYDECDMFGQRSYQISQESGAEYTPNFSDVANTERGEDPEVGKANAALISSAPLMYETLKQFAEMFTDTKKYPDPETITTGLRIFLPKALDALKKAKGEA